ncbi:MAG: hypothetical protein RR900_01920 [Ruthenibacterium sp.]
MWNGKLLICLSSALETWQYCADDTPTIAGLFDVTEKLLQDALWCQPIIQSLQRPLRCC